jgi:ligand-binding sensor domain-containing protein
MLEDQSGQLWVGFQGSGLVRYSGQRLTTFTEKDGLPNNAVFGLWEDRQERLWINTAKGTCLYDGAQFTLLEATKGQRRGVVLEDRHGHLWTEQANGPHVDRWDGKHFERHTLPVRDASLVRSVRPLLEDRVGRLWFSARGSGGGLYLYDGTRWTPFTNDIDQPHHQISRMLQDRHGRLWFAGEQGVSRYDGQKVDRFTTEHGLAHNSVGDLVEAQDGRLWFATDGGLSRYDGQTFTNFTAEHSLSPRELMLDRDGHLWLTTFGVGVARFDGQVFQYITVKEGLAHNGVHPILQDHHGDIWIGTDGGLNRYRPSTVPPKIQLQAVIADHRYVATGTVHIPQFQKLIAFEFQGSSLTTLPDRMAYVYRLAGYDDVWQTVYSNRVEYQGLPEGEYTFQVKAVDCDLNYSEAPATVAVEVYPQSFVSPVRLEKIHLEDVFASFYTSYAQRPLGSVQAVNDDDQPAQVTLGFFVPELMRQPFEQTLTLPPQSDQAVDLLPRLEADILQMRDTRTLG